MTSRKIYDLWIPPGGGEAKHRRGDRISLSGISQLADPMLEFFPTRLNHGGLPS